MCGDTVFHSMEEIPIKHSSKLSNVHSTISLKELGILDNPNFKICFLLDSGAMITVLSPKYGLIEVGALCLCKCCDK